MKKNEPIKTQLRIPVAVQQKLIEAAEENGRSMNAEIVKRLEASFEGAADLIQLGIESGEKMGSQAAQIQLLQEEIQRLRQIRDDLWAKAIPGLPIELTDARSAIEAMKAATKLLEKFSLERGKKGPAKSARRSKK